jgi:hypothetical protein
VAGEALSAVLLTATAERLATSAMSDLVEDTAARTMLRRMLGNVGHPAVGIRVGVPGSGALPPQAPRRAATGAVEVVAGPPAVQPASLLAVGGTASGAAP